MSPSLPWGRWTAAGPALQLHAPPAKVERLPWGSWLAPQRSAPADRAEAPAPVPAPALRPAPTASSSAPVTAVGQLARATAEAQHATAQAHRLWLRQQEEALEILACMNRTLRAALPEDR